MKVLIQGGIFRLPDYEIATLQPAPEVVLARGLRDLGVTVVTKPLEDRTASLSRNFDITHVHHASRAAVVASALAPMPTVFTLHGAQRPSRLKDRAGLKVIMRRADHLVCLSRAEQAWTQQNYGVGTDRITVIPNGIRPVLDEIIVREREDAELRLLYVGQLISLKRVDRAIAAIRDNADATLRVVFHNDELLDDLSSLAARLGVAARVTFVGRRSGAELAEEYRRAHALVLPSETEALPSVVTEALQTGLPVIASDVGGIRGQLDGSGLLIDPSADAALSNAVREINMNYSHHARDAAAKAETARIRFSPAVMAADHLALYRRLLED